MQCTAFAGAGGVSEYTRGSQTWKNMFLMERAHTIRQYQKAGSMGYKTQGKMVMSWPWTQYRNPATQGAISHLSLPHLSL